MSDKKYREFWIVNDVTFRDAVGRMAYSDKSFAKGDILHVVDAESYQDLERKLAESEAFIAKLIEENKWFAERMKQDE